jgi:hypothetical protein
MAVRMSPRYLLPVFAVLLALAPPAAASRESRAWQRILAVHHVVGRSEDVYVLPGRNVHRRVSFVIGVRGSAQASVFFGDALYGATAWVYRRGKWRRHDTAEVRAAAAPELEPGQRAHVRLPLKWHARRVRVLVRIPADHRAAWADVS